MLLAACTGRNGAPGNAIPQVPATALGVERAKTSALVFVTNNDGAVRAYRTNANGNASPVRTLAGANTQLSIPTGIAVAGDGRLGVSNVNNGSGQLHVLTFAANANGNVAPATAISCGGTTVPLGAAFDLKGDLYVTNGDDGNNVTVFTPSDDGCVSGNRVIAGPNTTLIDPFGVHVDKAGRVFVVDQSAIVVFAPGATGNATPVASISGSKTTLVAPSDVAIDAKGEIVVTDFRSDSISIFAADANADVAPLRSIRGSHTRLNGPNGISLDAKGNVYVANMFGNTITVYSGRAQGDAAPIRTIAGSKTGLSAPYKLAVSD